MSDKLTIMIEDRIQESRTEDEYHQNQNHGQHTRSRELPNAGWSWYKLLGIQNSIRFENQTASEVERRRYIQYLVKIAKHFATKTANQTKATKALSRS